MARDLLVRGGVVVDVDGVGPADVLIREGSIHQVGPGLSLPAGGEGGAAEGEVWEAAGKLLFPGLIDTQVHFREPGAEHKEDLASGSLAAVAGGITSFCDMPNTRPPTTDPERLGDKLERARDRAWADHAFFLGATAENAEQLGEWEELPGCAGVKMFLGSSTGNLLVPDDPTIERVLRSGRRRVAVHSEDQPRLAKRYAALTGEEGIEAHPEVRDIECAVRATRRLLDLVEKTGRPVHILHLSTAEELALVRERDLGELVTCEATPNHLFLVAPECYRLHGTRAQMNPPVRDRRHQEALREAVANGPIACIGSDHAPHLAEEKDLPWPRSPSGIPGVQTTLPLLLTAVREGWLQLEDIVRLLGRGPAEVYGVAGKGRVAPGFDGDLVLVDPAITGPLPREWLRSRPGFSPYEGVELAGWPMTSILGGEVVYSDHASLGKPRGRPLTFDKPT
jgi:dihydroorotase